MPEFEMCEEGDRNSRMRRCMNRGGSTRRPTRELALKRNLLVAACADGVLIPSATPGGVAETVARAAAQWGKPLWTFEDEENAALSAPGAVGLGQRRSS